MEILLSEEKILGFRDGSSPGKCVSLSFRPPVKMMHCKLLPPCLQRFTHFWYDSKQRCKYGSRSEKWFLSFQKRHRKTVCRWHFGGLTIQANQVTCTSVMSFRLRGNIVLFYGYIKEMAPGQTKLSIFNAPVCSCVCICVLMEDWERLVKVFLALFQPHSFLDELSML